jgi:hypothetical protein
MPPNADFFVNAAMAMSMGFRSGLVALLGKAKAA